MVELLTPLAVALFVLGFFSMVFPTKNENDYYLALRIASLLTLPPVSFYLTYARYLEHELNPLTLVTMVVLIGLSYLKLKEDLLEAFSRKNFPSLLVSSLFLFVFETLLFLKTLSSIE